MARPCSSAISAPSLSQLAIRSVAVREIRGPPDALGGSAGTAARSTAGILVTDSFCGTSLDDALGLRATGLRAGLAGAGLAVVGFRFDERGSPSRIEGIYQLTG